MCQQYRSSVGAFIHLIFRECVCIYVCVYICVCIYLYMCVCVYVFQLCTAFSRSFFIRFLLFKKLTCVFFQEKQPGSGKNYVWHDIQGKLSGLLMYKIVGGWTL